MSTSIGTYPKAPVRNKPRIKAVSPIDVPSERCAKGKKLVHEFRVTYDRDANNENWQIIMGRAWLPYARHAAKCTICRTYELEHKRIKSIPKS